MTKTLIIAEKPSVAQDIVRALTPAVGKFDKEAEYFENERYIVTSAVGHLVEIKAPEEYDVKRGKWSFANLPVIPPHFELAPIDKAKTRLNAVVKLVKRKDVSALINACDAGREGELIFRLIVQYAGAGKKPIDKPIQRLWLQSMTPQAIRDGFAQLRSDEQLRGLSDAARSRSEADWLVGINGTRAMTAFNSRDGGFFLTTVGRVADAHRSPSWSSARRRSASTWRGPTGRSRRASRPRPAATKASGSTPPGRRTPTTPNCAPTACGTRPTRRPSRKPAAASRPASPRRPSRARRVHPACTTSPPCSARPTRASGSVPRPRCRSRRRCTRSTRC